MARGFKTGGRVAGTKNRNTTETKELLQTIISKELDKLGLLLGKLEPLERVNSIAKLLPYILPKQSEIKTEVTNTEEMNPVQREKRIAELIAKAQKK